MEHFRRTASAQTPCLGRLGSLVRQSEVVCRRTSGAEQCPGRACGIGGAHVRPAHARPPPRVRPRGVRAPSARAPGARVEGARTPGARVCLPPVRPAHGWTAHARPGGARAPACPEVRWQELADPEKPHERTTHTRRAHMRTTHARPARVRRALVRRFQTHARQKIASGPLFESRRLSSLQHYH